MARSAGTLHESYFLVQLVPLRILSTKICTPRCNKQTTELPGALYMVDQTSKGFTDPERTGVYVSYAGDALNASNHRCPDMNVYRSCLEGLTKFLANHPSTFSQCLGNTMTRSTGPTMLCI